MPRLGVAFPPQSLPVVWARLVQHRFRVLVDTGAARRLIAPAVASSRGLRLVGTERLMGVTGTVATVPLGEGIGVGMGQREFPPCRRGDWIWGHDVLVCKQSWGSMPVQGAVSRSISQQDVSICCSEQTISLRPQFPTLRQRFLTPFPSVTP
jgi:hypothetical protein